MFRVTVTVPRITRAAIEEMERAIPGLTKVVTIPVVETEDEAKACAANLADKQLVRYEYVRELESLTETETGWNAVLICSGD